MTRTSAQLARALGYALGLALLTSPAAAATRKPTAEQPQQKKRDEAQQAAPKKPATAARGSLFAIVLGPGAQWKKGQPLKGPGLNEHQRYWSRLNAEGRIASAGPLGNDTGLILMRARSQAEANAAILADPAVKAKLLRGVARPYVAAMTNTMTLTGTKE